MTIAPSPEASGQETPCFAAQQRLALGRTRPTGGISKRALDVTVALSLLTVALPLMAMLYLMIRSTMGGPAIFAHKRLGHNGKTFNCYKFRTMVVDAEVRLREHLERNPEAAREWRETQKLRHDPRITRLGRILRRSSLDELPQLVNVLRGEMSCVGPRPIVPEELRHYGASIQEYFQARPGLTGAWQVSGRSRLGYADRVTLDTHYVRNWSMTNDFKILMKTAVVVMLIDEAF